MRPGLLFLVRAGIVRRPLRGAIITIAIAGLAALMATAAIVDYGSRGGLDSGGSRLGADLVAIPRGLDADATRTWLAGNPAAAFMDAAIEKKIAAFPFVERVSAQLFARSMPAGSCCSSHNILLVGFEPESDFTVRPWLPSDPDRALGPDDALVGAAFPAAGDTARFFGHVFRVAGRLDPTGLALDSAAFLPINTVRRMAKAEPGRLSPMGLPPDGISTVLIRLRPEGQGLPAYRAAYELEMAIPEVSIIQPDVLLVKSRRSLARAATTLRAGSYAVWPLTVLLTGLIFALAANERSRQIGLLRAMGATRSFIFGMILAEAVALSAAGAAAGLAIASAVMVMAAQSTAASASPLVLPPTAQLAAIIGGAAALAVVAGALAALLPAARAARMEPYEATRRPG